MGLFYENKQACCSAFAEFLKTTRVGAEIDCIEYCEIRDPEHPTWVREVATIFYVDDKKKPKEVCVDFDSGIAIAKDIMKALKVYD